MKSKTKQSTLLLTKSRIRFVFFNIIPFIFLFFSTSIFAQHQIQVKNQSAGEIVQLLENQFDIKFNFNHSNLPSGIFTYSCSGSQQDILLTSFSILNRKYVQLDESIFAIQKNIFPSEEKVAPILISGKVMDIFGNGLPIATVWIPSLEKAFETNLDGHFEIQGFFSDDEKVEFRYLGYHSQVKTIAQLFSRKNPKVVLQEQQHMLSEIVITDRSSNTISLEGLDDVVLPDQIMPIAGQADKDVLSIVKMLPGMYTSDESATEIQTRGGPPDQTNFEWNGIQLYQTSHFYGKISAINPFAVDRISIVRNGASAKNSGQASGTISMRDTDSVIDSLRGKVHSNLLYSNIGLNIPLLKNKAQLRVAWRKSYAQFFDNIIYNRFFDNSFQFGKVADELYYQDFYNLDTLVSLTPRLSFQDLFGSLKINLGKKDFIKISATKIENQFRYVKSGEVLDSSPSDDLQYDNSGFSVNYHRNWNNQHTTHISWSSSSFNYRNQFIRNPDSLAITDEQIQSNILDQSAFQFTQTYQQQKWKILTGFKFEKWNYDLYETGRRGSTVDVYYDDDLIAHEKSAFLQGLWKGSRFWQLEAGVRFSDYEFGEKNYWEPRIHASFFPIKNWTIHAHFGRYHQALNKKQLFNNFQVANGFWYLSNEQVDEYYVHVVENQQVSLGAKYQKKNWEFALDLYHKNSSDLWTSAFDFDVHSDPYVYTDLHIRGLEFSMKYNCDWLSLLWTYDRVDEMLTLENGSISNSPFTQPHRLSLFQAFQWRKWQMALHWKFSSGRYFSEPTGLDTYFDSVGDERPYILYDELLTGQLPNYHSLDLSLFYKFGTVGKKLWGQVGCSISNFYNRKNIIKNEFFLDYRPEELQISLHPWTGLPFSPNVVLEVEF